MLKLACGEETSESDWLSKFRNVVTSVDNAEHVGCVPAEYTELWQELCHCSKVDYELEISFGKCHTFVTVDVNMAKSAAKFMPQLLNACRSRIISVRGLLEKLQRTMVPL